MQSNNLIVKKYCEEKGLDYRYVINKIRHYKNAKEKDLPLEFQIELAMSTYVKRKNYTNIKYKGLRLIDYCKSANIEYRRIAYRCRYFIKVHGDFSLLTDEKIGTFINCHYYKKEINDLREVFSKLDYCSNNDYKNICKMLNINYNQLYKMSLKNNLDIKTLIYLSWYSNDCSSNNGIYISQNKIDDLLNYNNIQLNDLYGLYKSGYDEFLEKIFDYEKYYLIGFILRVVRKYNFKIYKSDYEDLFSEAKILLVKCIKRNVFNEIGRIIRYIEKTVTNQILTYLVKNYSNRILTFDDTKINIKQLAIEWNY